MSAEQKRWALALSFLEEVNLDTVHFLLPEADAGEVLAWFKKEPSIRSPEATRWRMLPIVRARFQESVLIDSPSQQAAYLELARRARPAPDGR